MLSREDNELLTRVGPGTPMEDLLRRYWMPAVLTAELPEADRVGLVAQASSAQKGFDHVVIPVGKGLSLADRGGKGGTP
jgi:hypothetical protein